MVEMIGIGRTDRESCASCGEPSLLAVYVTRRPSGGMSVATNTRIALSLCAECAARLRDHLLAITQQRGQA